MKPLSLDIRGSVIALDPRAQIDFRVGIAFDQNRNRWFMGIGIAHWF